VLEGRLFDAATGNMVFGKRYVGDPKFYRLIVHRFADDILFNLTGEKGVAQTASPTCPRSAARRKRSSSWTTTASTRRRSPGTSPSICLRAGPQTPDDRLHLLSQRESGPVRAELRQRATRRALGEAGAECDTRLVARRTVARRRHECGRRDQPVSDAEERGTPKALTTGPAISVSPSFPQRPPDCLQLRSGGTPQLYIVDVDGSNLRRLTFQGSYNASPRWSPRGEKIVFMCQAGGYQICLIIPMGPVFSN